MNETVQPPTVTITADATSIGPGTSAMLTVSASHALRLTLTGSDGSSYTINAAGGVQAIQPGRTTTYTAVAHGVTTDVSASITITVGNLSTPPPSVSITANPTTIVSGASSVLSATAANATQVTLAGSDGSSYALQANGGTVSVSPKANTTYTATAVGSQNNATASVAVTVTAPAAPQVSITANPASIVRGSTSTLNITASNATQVTVAGSDGSSYSFAADGGTKSVSPSATTTYTATATGTGGSITASATVTVTAPGPGVSIAANPPSINAGSSSTLTVVATNADAVTLSGSDGSTYTLAASGGTTNVAPTASTTYTATATGPSSKASASTTVTVVPAGAPTVSISVNPAAVTAGGSSTLTVSATKATGVAVSGTDGSSFTLAATGGTKTVAPGTTTTYTATASGIGGKSSASTTLTVTPAPTPTVTLRANPASITSGSSSVLTASATNASSLVITGSDGSNYPLPLDGGSVSVSPAATTTYTATASSGAASASATATVSVTQPAATVLITANPATITAGASSTLTITATNATQVTVSGSDGSSFALPASGGSKTVSPAKTTTYTAIASGANGNASASATITVKPVAPTVSINANPTSIIAGASSTLTVGATDATQVIVYGSDGSSFPVSASGGSITVSPATSTTYTATASGPGGSASAATTVTVNPVTPPTVSITASPATIASGASSTLTISAMNATQLTVSGSDGTSYPVASSGGTQVVTPASTATYTATATNSGGSSSSSTIVTVTVPGSVQSVNHVILMLQENHTFDNYFGMLNPYRAANGMSVGDDGQTYSVDGIDDKLGKITNQSDENVTFAPFKFKSTCIDDLTSSWLESYGDVNRYDFSLNRQYLMDGFVHTAQNYEKNCAASGGKSCSGASNNDPNGQRSMGFYDQDFLNYYYYMASQFAVSDRWFSPVSSKSIPNRIATFTGGTTQGLVFDPGSDDHQPQLLLNSIFEKLDSAKVSWKIYYTVTQGGCLSATNCAGGASDQYPATDFSYLGYANRYVYENPTAAACTAPTVASSAVGDQSNSFCIDPNHIAPVSSYFKDVTENTLPSFSFIEAGYGNNDEHPGSGQSVLAGQVQVANILNSLMTSPSWKDSIFFLAYDEGGGPYDHVPPVPGHSNDNTAPTVGGTSVSNIPDISSIAVNADSYFPCVRTNGAATAHCDIFPNDPGATSTDAAAVKGFVAQLGFRVPNMIVSPFTRKHYVSHVPMDHTAILKFVESRFINSGAYLTARDAAQPDLLNLFDFNAKPWLTPPVPPSPVTPATLGYDPCLPANFAP